LIDDGVCHAHATRLMPWVPAATAVAFVVFMQPGIVPSA
jgi:hypothetical protein